VGLQASQKDDGLLDDDRWIVLKIDFESDNRRMLGDGQQDHA
jgi:hypothetical protein